VRSEAAVVVYLQKKSDAKRVYADVVHVRNNTDGFKSVGMVCPSGKMQGLNNKALYRDVGLDPNRVGYVEAHGTGTKVRAVFGS
jgi:fatty acid synthase